MAFSDVCKVEFGAYVEKKVSKGQRKKDIIKQFAKDVNISEDTIKNWMYPKKQANYEKKRTKSKKRVDSDPRLNPDTLRFTEDLAGFIAWNEAMKICLKFSSNILKNKVTWKTDEEEKVVKNCFRLVDAFFKAHIKNPKDRRQLSNHK